MAIFILTVFTEYISIVLFLHKAANKKNKIKFSSIIFLEIDLLLAYLSGYNHVFNVLIYVFWFIYIRIRVADSFRSALKPYGIMMITIPTVQMMSYALLSAFVQYVLKSSINITLGKAFMNVIFCIAIILWKNKYLYNLLMGLKNFNKNVILFMITGILIYILIKFKNSDALRTPFNKSLIVSMMIITLTVMLLEIAEIEKKSKVEELALYEKYTNVFEEALSSVRMRQHEFDNHINAIRCMRYVIEDKEELFREQQKYCATVIKENRFNKVLFLKVPPILSGYLYYKFNIAAEQGVQIAYEVQEIERVEKISMKDLIEVLGILFDNAVEALVNNGKQKLKVCIYDDEDGRFVVEVLNESDRIPNEEIAKFFKEGYSTKGEDRGIGLSRLRDLKKRYKAELLPANITIDNINYLWFRMVFGKNKKRSH